MKTFVKLSVGGISKEILLQKLSVAGVQFNAYAYAIFENSAFVIPEVATEFELVKVTALDLGILASEYSFEEILAAGAALGLAPCPLASAAFLRLHNEKQPEGPYLTVVSERPFFDQTLPCGLYLRFKDGISWLRGYKVEGTSAWPPENEFVFCKR